MECRLCLSDEGSMDDIFSSTTSSIDYVQKIYECTDLRLCHDEDLPNYICEVCRSELIIWLKFKRQCVRANEHLQVKYPNIPTTTDCTVNSAEKDTQTDFYEIESYIQEEVDDLESNYKNDYDLKKDKLFDNDLVEYTEIEFENPELSEFIDHTYTEGEGTPKRNIFKFKTQGIENDDDDDNYENDVDGACEKIDEHTDIEVYSLLHLNGEDDTLEVNENSEFYNIDENDEVEMLTVSDDNEASVQTYFDLPSDDKSQTSDLQNSTSQSQSELYEVKKSKTKRRKVEQKSDDVQEVVKTTNKGKRSYSYSCTICGQMQTNLKQHLLTHNEDLPYICPYGPECTRAFRQKSNLKNHINIHTGEKPYACKLCTKAFPEPSGLRSHMVLHTKAKPYHCADCGKSFGWSHTLKAHQRIHTQDRRHPCNYCNKRFLSAHALKKHIRIHTGEKPYECDTCQKQFNTSGNLVTHKRIHLKDRPFSCHLCSEKFMHLSSLKLHVKQGHHQRDPGLILIKENDDGYKIEVLLAEVTKDD